MIRDEEKCRFENALERPLPLKLDDEWQQVAPFAPPPPQHCLYSYGKENYIYFYFDLREGQKQKKKTSQPNL